MTRIVIIGGGPGGYEAALVAAQLGAQVTMVEQDGPGGACVLTDCVPSKTLIATSVRKQALLDAPTLGVGFTGGLDGDVGVARVDLPLVNKRVKELAQAQSADIATRVRPRASRSSRRAAGWSTRRSSRAGDRAIRADVVLVATGATPRVLPGAEPDGERILTWRQLYDLDELPEHLIVVGSGVTGAEFAGAYRSLGSEVTLVSRRDRMMPNEDADGAEVLEEVYRRRGMNVMGRSRAASVKRTADGVVVDAGGRPHGRGHATA